MRAVGGAILAACFGVAICEGQASAAPVVVTTASDEAVAYQINVAHTGSTNLSTGFKTPLTQLWSVNLSVMQSYAVIAEGAVFTVGSDGVVTSLDVTTGTTRWSKPLSVGVRSQILGPAYDNGTLFVLNTSDLLTALSAKNGKTQWVSQLSQLFSDAPPMAVNGQVFVGGTETGGTLYALDEATGHVQWSEPVQNGDFSSPAYGGGAVFVSYPCQFYKFDPATGEREWYYNGGVEGGGGETPVFFNKKVYIEDLDCGSLIVKASNGKFVGKFDEPFAGVNQNPTLFTGSNGKPIGLSLSGNSIVAWNGKNGKQLWSFVGDADPSSFPIVVNGIVVDGTYDGSVFFLDEKGRQLWSTKTPNQVSSFSAGEGTLIVVSENFVTAYVPSAPR